MSSKALGLLLAMTATVCVLIGALLPAQPAHAQADCDPSVSSDQPSVNGAPAAVMYDGNIGSVFESTWQDWQYMQIDFHCTFRLSAMRRLMLNANPALAVRNGQGEGFAYSMDGATWTAVTADATIGWEGYDNYGAAHSAWDRVVYGWSAWLTLKTPVEARFLRFQWDGDHDAVGEVEVLFPGYTGLETLTVPADGTVVTSATVLEAGVRYRLRASGQIAIGGPGSGDAEYAYNADNSTILDQCNNFASDVDMGIGVDGVANLPNQNPYWGKFDASHTYATDFVGAGAPIQLNYQDCDYRDNTGALTVEIYRADSAISGFAVQESLPVSAGGTPAESRVRLDQGVHYKIQITGQVATGGLSGDADYQFDAGAATLNDRCSRFQAGVDVGVGINDAINDSQKFPQWGAYNPQHIYLIDYIGTGSPITFTYHDCDYGDNSGALVARIFQPTPVTKGARALVDFEDLATGTAVFNQYDGVTFPQGADPSQPVTIAGNSTTAPSPPHALAYTANCFYQPPLAAVQTSADAAPSTYKLPCYVQLLMQFDEPQYQIDVAAGINDQYRPNAAGYALRMEGYAEGPALPGSRIIARTVSACLGQPPTPVNRPITLLDYAGRIRYATLAVVRCDNPGETDIGGNDYPTVFFPVLYLDNLIYDRPLNPPPHESDPPLVTILAPAPGSAITGDFPGLTVLAAHLLMTDTALSSVSAALNGAAPVRLSFGRRGAQAFGADTYLGAWAGLHDGANTLVVQVRDFDRPQNTTSATVSFNYTTKPVPPPSTIDIMPTAVEATQTIDDGPRLLTASDYQDSTYQVSMGSDIPLNFGNPPLLRGKDTLVRVYAAAAGSAVGVPNVNATMEVYKDDCTIGCYIDIIAPTKDKWHAALVNGLWVPALSDSASAPANAAPYLNNTWNFFLYGNWTVQNLRLVVHLNDAFGRTSVPECENNAPMTCYRNNTIELHLRFQPRPKITVHPVLVRVTGEYDGFIYNHETPTSTQQIKIFRMLNSLYPAYVATGNLYALDVSPKVRQVDLLDAVESLSDDDPGTLFMAIMPVAKGTQPFPLQLEDVKPGYVTLGSAWRGQVAAWAMADQPMAAAHELGHELGFDHASCNHNEKTDDCNAYPIPHGGLGVYGTDIENWTVIAPGVPTETSYHGHELMSYGPNPWVSRSTYDTLLIIFTFLVHDLEARRAPAAVVPALRVRGAIAADGTVSFRPIYQITSDHVITDTVSAEVDAGAIYTLRGVDGVGDTLFVHNFVPAAVDVHTADQGKILHINEVVPYLPTLRRVDLGKGPAVLGSILNGAPDQPPTVSIDAPAGGATWPVGSVQTVRWTMNSPAGQPLTAMVQYSADGGVTRRTLARDVAATSLAVNTDELAGSANAMLYVQVSDGMNTAEAQAGPFTVAPKPPVVQITAPLTGAIVYAGVPMALAAWATDREEALADDQIHWVSSLDGDLGTGTQVVKRLQLGVHRLTATVTDSQGRTGQDSITVVVAPPPAMYLPFVTTKAGR